MSGMVIIINGIGSVGKSTTAKAIQKHARDHFLHVQGDVFLEMISPRLWNTAEGITFSSAQGNDGHPEVSIVMGPEIDRLMNGMKGSVAALSESGNNLLVDDVMLSSSDQRAYRKLMPNTDLRFVGMHAPLQTLELRERHRGDRLIGLARWQWASVHKDIEYDLEVDTTDKSPDDIAKEICIALNIG